MKKLIFILIGLVLFFPFVSFGATLSNNYTLGADGHFETTDCLSGAPYFGFNVGIYPATAGYEPLSNSQHCAVSLNMDAAGMPVGDTWFEYGHDNPATAIAYGPFCRVSPGVWTNTACYVPPTCGDFSCNGDETCANCPNDCMACPFILTDILNLPTSQATAVSQVLGQVTWGALLFAIPLGAGLLAVDIGWKWTKRTVK